MSTTKPPEKWVVIEAGTTVRIGKAIYESQEKAQSQIPALTESQGTSKKLVVMKLLEG